MELNQLILQIPAEEMEFILKHGERINGINEIKSKPLLQFSFEIVKYELPELLKNNDFVGVSKLLLGDNIRNVNINNLLNFVLWVLAEIDDINNLESTYLNSEPDIDLLMAGIKDLDVFGYINVVDTLAQGDILKWDEILKLPYQRVFDKMLKNNIENRIQRNYQKIISKKK